MPEGSFSSSLSNAAKETRMAATETREAAPIMSLSSQMQSSGQSMAAPLVTKDELIEGSKISMSA